MGDTKVCARCGRTLPATTEFFYVHSGDRLRRECKDCTKGRCRDYYAEHREECNARCTRYYFDNHEREVEARREYRLAHLPEEQARKRAYYDQHCDELVAYAQSWYEENRERQLENVSRWTAAHPELCREYDRRWRQRHPELCATHARNRRGRVKAASGSHTTDDVLAQYARQKGRCYWCGEKVGNEYHVDHVIPIALGGSNGPENLVVACPACNQTKHAKHPMDFAGRLC